MDHSHDPQETFAAEYTPMSDKELLDVAAEYDDLVEPAQAAVRDELKKRGLEMPKPDEKPAVNEYDGKSNSQLMEIARGYDSLPEVKQAALREEFAARGLDAPLIDDDSDAAGSDDALLNDPVSDFITVRTFRDLSAAYVARAYLETLGIPTLLRDENTIRADWFLSNALGGAKLQVPSAYVQEADEKLSQPIPPSFEHGADQEFVQPVCPKCGSLDVVADDTDRKIKTGSVVMFPLATPALSALPLTAKGDWKCNTCGCKWIDDGEAEPASAALNS
jgi:hypothetical protein